MFHSPSYYFPASSGVAQGSLFRRAAAELREGRADVVLGPFVLTEKEMEECDFSTPVAIIKYVYNLDITIRNIEKTQCITLLLSKLQR